MGASSFNEMEIDAIGEIMNISLGASATAVSTLLGTKVDITTPVVRVQSREEFEFKKLEPAIGVEIAYVEGLAGKNVMMFRKEDVRIIVGTLLGSVPDEEAFEMDEICISAICEIMNQMMGASATALSEFLGFPVNISTPKSFDVGEPEEFKEKYFPDEEGMVVVRFRLEIEEKLNSEFMNIMSADLAKRLLTPFGLGGDSTPEPVQEKAPEPAPQPAAPAASGDGGSMSQEEMDALMASMSAPAAEPAPAASGGGSMSQEEMDALMNSMSAPAAEPAPAASAGGGNMSQEEMDALMNSMSAPAAEPAPAAPQAGAVPQQPYYPYPAPAMDPMMLQLLNQMQQTQMQMMEMMKPKQQESSRKESSIIRPLSSEQIRDEAGDGMEDKTNQEMLMKVPLEISVEIGRTKRLVRDILEFTQGTLVVLDKMAGEQVDLFVNGQCIARGDIVVVEDNFGIRITEIVSKEINPESL
ncbi:MAG: flagellar motor switch protein FliN [Lachnospiraceae bacterium]|jgi:flagellar motor switch protein FliN/FliY|nr:flagellar motor switch protein FliN [Lachnospiraceae bacterium]